MLGTGKTAVMQRKLTKAACRRIPKQDCSCVCVHTLPMHNCISCGHQGANSINYGADKCGIRSKERGHVRQCCLSQWNVLPESQLYLFQKSQCR